MQQPQTKSNELNDIFGASSPQQPSTNVDLMFGEWKNFLILIIS